MQKAHADKPPLERRRSIRIPMNFQGTAVASPTLVSISDLAAHLN